MRRGPFLQGSCSPDLLRGGLRSYLVSFFFLAAAFGGGSSSRSAFALRIPPSFDFSSSDIISNTTTVTTKGAAAAATTTTATTTTAQHRREQHDALTSDTADNKNNDNDKGKQQQRQQRRRANVAKPKSPDDHLVRKLPLLHDDDEPLTHWAGHLPASYYGDKYFFYWLFAPTSPLPPSFQKNVYPSKRIPLLIWLNGGPGCSSMDGLFLENGPLKFFVNNREEEDKIGGTTGGEYQLTKNDFSWHTAPAYTLYIDQPVGTGLSFTTDHRYPKNDEEVNVDFYWFLQSFFELHGDKFVVTVAGGGGPVVKNPVYFSGESHAGHYIPHIMNYILKENDNLIEGNIKIPLAGAAIGNGWIHPYYQYSAARAAYGHALIDHAQLMALNEKEGECQKLIQQGLYSEKICTDLLDDIVAQSHGADNHYKVSMYDVRRTEIITGNRDFPPGHHVIETYLGGHPLPPGSAAARMGKLDQTIYREVLHAIHALAVVDDANQTYLECTDPPYLALKHQDGKGVVQDVVDILEHRDNIRLLFFNGVEDLICNHIGNEMVLENLPWTYQKEWIKAKRYAWTASSEQKTKISGYMKEFENLLFLKILSAGHMVPMDVPQTSLEMMQIFMHNGSFAAKEQKLDRSVPQNNTCSSETNQSPAGESSSPNFALPIMIVIVTGCCLGVYNKLYHRKYRYPRSIPFDEEQIEFTASNYEISQHEIGSTDTGYAQQLTM